MKRRIQLQRSSKTLATDAGPGTSSCARSVGLALLACAFFAGWSASRAGVMIPIPGDPVTIDTGKISGTLLASGDRAYYGIPYAAPPVRELRWRAPMPAKPWTGIYNADTEKPGCVTTDDLPNNDTDGYTGEELRAEDCLYLNLWVPASAKPGSRLPVMVWIHGGGFNSLQADDPHYGGQEIVKKGVIYLTIEYRTGIIGWLALPELAQESGVNAAGDWGLLDQVAGLKWVQRNIAAFGGDPSNVTLLGESAGSMSISGLQASPLTHGLFAHVVGMSGTLMPAGETPDSLQVAEAKGAKLQEAMKMSSVAQMRTLSWDRVREAWLSTHQRAWPDIDGYFLPDQPGNIFDAGNQNDVPVLATGTANDLLSDSAMGQVKTLAEYQALAAKQFGNSSAEFLEVWPAKTDAEAAAQGYQVNSETGFGLAARDWARRQATTGKQPSYLGMIARIQPYAPGAFPWTGPNAPITSCHACDIVYWFGTLELHNMFSVRRNITPWDKELTNRMQDVLVAFAKTGDPSTAAVPFPKYDPKDERRVVFGDTVFLQKLNTPGIEFLMSHPIPRGFPGGPPPAAAGPPPAGRGR